MKIRREAIAHSRVSLLGFLCVTGENNQSLLVRLQSFNIHEFSLLAQISPSVVHDDTHTPRFLSTNTSLLELCKSKSTPLTDFPVVPYGLRTDGRAEESERTDAEGSSFGLACVATTKFASWLVKPGTDAALPVLAEMICVEDVVVAETHRLLRKSSSAVSNLYSTSRIHPVYPAQIQLLSTDSKVEWNAWMLSGGNMGV